MRDEKKDAGPDFPDPVNSLPTPSGMIHAILNERELYQLHKMLQEADNEMKTQQLIGLFEKVE